MTAVLGAPCLWVIVASRHGALLDLMGGFWAHGTDLELRASVQCGQFWASAASQTEGEFLLDPAACHACAT